MNPVKGSNWLLDTCVYRDFTSINRIPLFESIIPNPCHTAQLQRDRSNEIGPPFCERIPIHVPEIAAKDLVEATRRIRTADTDWALSAADMQIIGYAICTGFGVLTRDGALRHVARGFRLEVAGTLELLDTGVKSGQCDNASAIEAVNLMLKVRPPRRIRPEYAQPFLKRWA